MRHVVGELVDAACGLTLPKQPAFEAGRDQQLPANPSALFFEVFLTPIFVSWRTGGMMLFGMALYKLGVCYSHMNRGDEAMRVFQSVVQNYGESDYAEQAEDEIHDLD